MLSIDKQSGNAVQKTGFGNVDHKYIRVRTGVANVQTSETLLNSHRADGLIDVSSFSQMSLLIDYSAGSPGLDSCDIIIKYTDINNVIVAKPVVLSAVFNSPSMTLSVNDIRFQVISTGNYIFTVPLPPAKYAKIFVDATGTATLSQLGVDVGLGWGSSGFQLVNKA